MNSLDVEKKVDENTSLIVLKSDKVIEALKKYYWQELENRTGKNEFFVPIDDMLDVVDSAIKSGLEQKSECTYAGSVFVFSVIEGTDRTHSTDVVEVNELFTAGKELAIDVWNGLSAGTPLSGIREELVNDVTIEYNKTHVRNMNHRIDENAEN